MVITKNSLLKGLSIHIPSITTNSLINCLFKLGVDLNVIHKKTPPGIVTGTIQSCCKVENSTKLFMCSVLLCGDGRMLNIICGDNSVKTGLKVVVAPIGTKLEKVNIAERKILGHKSEGMICSFGDIYGMTVDQDSIIKLEGEQNISDLEGDFLEMEIPANRTYLKDISILQQELLCLMGADVKCEHYHEWVILDWSFIEQLTSIPNPKQLIPRMTLFNFDNSLSCFQGPIWRGKMTQSDFVEELFKFITLEELNSQAPVIPMANRDNWEFLILEKVRCFLKSNNFVECRTYNLTSKKKFNQFLFVGSSHTLMNGKDSRFILRTHAVLELIEVMRRNKLYRYNLCPIFEINYSQGSQSWVLNIVIPKMNQFCLNNSGLVLDTHDLISLIETILYFFGYHPVTWISHEHKNLKDCIYCQEVNGYIGTMDGCSVALLTLPNIPKKYPALSNEFPSLTPPSFKDFSIFFDGDLTILFKQLYQLNAIQKIKLLEEFVLENKTSYLIRVRFHGNCTLNNTSTLMDGVQEILMSEGAVIR